MKRFGPWKSLKCRGPKTIFFQNPRLKLDAARIFSDLPAQLAQVCSLGFPLPGEALTYHDLTTIK